MPLDLQPRTFINQKKESFCCAFYTILEFHYDETKVPSSNLSAMDNPSDLRYEIMVQYAN